VDYPQDVPDHAMYHVDRLVRWIAYLGSIAMASLVVITGIAVVFRYIIKDPIFGIYDISEMVLLTTVACSFAYGGRKGAHVAVDVLSMVGGRRVTRWTDFIVRLLGISIIFVTVYALIVQGSCGFRCGHFTPNLAIPFKPFYMILAFGLGAYGIVLIAELFSGLRHFRDSVDPNEKNI
ncbi:uncharacterized protein METZ01_LOCUS467337, partial [marine metagenome]